MARRRSSPRRGRTSPSKRKDHTPDAAKDRQTEQCVEVEGTIKAVLAGTMFKVEIDGTSHQLLAHISGKMRKRFIRLVVGDRVKLEMSPYDTSKARIVFRLRDPRPRNQG